MQKTKLYCYVDETGQDTFGKFFLVSIVLMDLAIREGLAEKLESIEIKTGKKKTKWTKTSYGVRREFLKKIAYLAALRNSIFYSIYAETKTYTQLTSLSIAKAVLAKGENNYSVTVIIDGLTKADTEKVRRELKKLKVKYDNIRGMKDEQSVFLRLADCIAGFLRDYVEKQPYTKEIFALLKEKKIIVEA